MKGNMKTLKILLPILLICGLAVGQNGPQQQIFNAAAPNALNQLSLSVVGPLGQSTYYYYIITNYPIGSVASNSFIVTNAPTTLTSGNFVQLNWNAIPGATSYTVVRSKTSPSIFTRGSGGSCASCVIVQNLVATSYADQITPTLPYTLSPIPASAESIYLDNQDYSTPHLLYTTLLGPS